MLIAMQVETISKERFIRDNLTGILRSYIRRELIERQILDAQELTMMCFVAKDLDSMIYYYKIQLHWQEILKEYNKCVQDI